MANSIAIKTSFNVPNLPLYVKKAHATGPDSSGHRAGLVRTRVSAASGGYPISDQGGAAKAIRLAPLLIMPRLHRVLLNLPLLR